MITMPEINSTPVDSNVLDRNYRTSQFAHAARWFQAHPEQIDGPFRALVRALCEVCGIEVKDGTQKDH